MKKWVHLPTGENEESCSFAYGGKWRNLLLWNHDGAFWAIFYTMTTDAEQQTPQKPAHGFPVCCSWRCFVETGSQGKGGAVFIPLWCSKSALTCLAVVSPADASARLPVSAISSVRASTSGRLVLKYSRLLHIVKCSRLGFPYTMLQLVPVKLVRRFC